MAAEDLTPTDWLARLGPAIRSRVGQVHYWSRYYRGDHDLPSGPSQHRDAYLRFQAKARTNLCGLCADSRVHRMRVIGVSDGTSGGSNDALWKLWQKARLDSRQTTVYRRAFYQSASYVIVGPSPEDPKVPRVSIEGPLNVTVAHDPAEPSVRLAAMRLWHDPYAKRWHATVWTPGRRDAFQTVREYKDSVAGDLQFSSEAWEPRADPARSTPGIPVVPFENGDEGEEPTAAFAGGGIDVQDRLNLTVLNRLTAERYAAFRQKYLMNYTPEEDPETGLALPPFNPGADQVWTVPPPEPGEAPPQIGDFAQTDTSGILQAVSGDIRSFAAVTLTPVYYLPGGDLINISADAVQALDAAHVQAVRERIASWSEAWEEVIGLMAGIADLSATPDDLSQSEVRWALPENIQPGVMADYGTKLSAIGYPLPIIAERLGDSPQQIAALRSEAAKAQLQAALATAAAAPAPAAARPAASTQPGAPAPARPAGTTTPGAPRPAATPAARPAPRPAPARP